MLIILKSILIKIKFLTCLENSKVQNNISYDIFVQFGIGQI